MTPFRGAGGRSPAGREEALVGCLEALAPALDDQPDPRWRATTRARLVAMAAVRTPGPEDVAPSRRSSAPGVARRRRRARLTVGLAGAAAAVTGAAAVVALAADARPGDALYGVKRGTEQTRLALAGDARGSTLLALAGTRLDEVSLLLSDAAPPDVVDDVLSTMDAQTTDGAAWLLQHAVDTGSGAALEDLGGWAARQSARVAALEDDVPAAAADDAADSAALLDRVAARVDDLRAALGCPTGPATSGTDDLGPVPVACPGTRPPPGAGGPGAPSPGDPATTTLPTPSRAPSEVPSAPPSGGRRGVPSGPGGPGADAGEPAPTRSGRPPGPGVPGPGSPGPALPDIPGPGLPGPALPDVPLTGPGTPAPPVDRNGRARPPAVGSAIPAPALPGSGGTGVDEVLPGVLPAPAGEPDSPG